MNLNRKLPAVCAAMALALSFAACSAPSSSSSSSSSAPSSAVSSSSAASSSASSASSAVEESISGLLNLTLSVGDVAAMKVVVQPENVAVTYTSSDEEVATVGEDGIVTTVGPGKATLTATTAGGAVWETPVVVHLRAESIALDTESLSLSKGDTAVLTPSFLPENADKGTTVKWTSSDEAVAVVDKNGNVTAQGAGSAVITAINNYGMTAVCNVTVK